MFRKHANEINLAEKMYAASFIFKFVISLLQSNFNLNKTIHNEFRFLEFFLLIKCYLIKFSLVGDEVKQMYPLLCSKVFALSDHVLILLILQFAFYIWPTSNTDNAFQFLEIPHTQRIKRFAYDNGVYGKKENTFIQIFSSEQKMFLMQN